MKARGAHKTSRGWLFCVVLVLWGWCSRADAHDFRPGVLSIEPLESEGDFALRWVDAPGVQAALPRLGLKGGCELRGELPVAELHCGAEGLRGELRIEGLGADRPEAIVQIATGGGERTVVVSVDSPVAALGRDGEAGTRPEGFFALGLRHIAGGLDHLLFVALLFAGNLLGPDAGAKSRRTRLGSLGLALTGFTLAHSLSLVAVLLGWLPSAGAAIEAWIAASLVIAAAEIVRAWRGGRPARVGWGLVLVFGLVHGLGFASALLELLGGGSDRWAALLAFNLGIEAGQLLFVLALWILVFAVGRTQGDLRRVSWATWPCLLPLYAIGTVAAAWTVERALVIFG